MQQISMTQKSEYSLFYYPSLIGVCADSAYRKHFKNNFEKFHNTRVDISERVTSTFQVIPKRWRIERTFSWLCHSRRLSKDYEIRTIYAETMVVISHLHTLLYRFQLYVDRFLIYLFQVHSVVEHSEIILQSLQEHTRKFSLSLQVTSKKYDLLYTVRQETLQIMIHLKILYYD